jgi:putative ABC transport system substrate-binding protein
MRRREFISLLGGAAAGWPLAARAQQPAMPVIGFVRSTAAASAGHLLAAFQRGLNEAGFIEGQNVAVRYAWADENPERLRAQVTGLIDQKVAVIVAGGIQSAHAAKAATSTIPVVFVVGGDPVRLGLASSLSRPLENLTGVSFISGVDLVGKRLGLLNELMPKADVLAFLSDPLGEASVSAAEEAGRVLGRRVLVVAAGNERELNEAFATIVRSGAEALHVGGGSFVTNRRRLIVALAARHGLPTIYTIREFVEAGGLMSYGPSQTDAYRRAGVYAGRILKGEKTTDLPIQLPTKFDLVINLATAKALGLEIPPMLLARADDVIE